ncbi:hypothetical protein AAH071_08290 [Parabacteroides distasonis]
MNNDKLKFVVDSRSFDGSCVTTMSDGIHGDYHHETLEELRDREKNPYLIAVSGNTVRKMIRIHLQSLCAPFSEITEERYFDYMDVLPPSAIPGISFSWESLPVPLRRIVREFIRRFVRYHGLNAVTETWYYELAMEELDDWKNRDPEASPQTIRKYKRLAESYQSGKIAKTLKRMEGKPFCTDLEEKVRKYRAAVKEERKLLELIREGMGLITPGNPCIMQYGYDWAYERSPDFPPIDLDCQIMLAYSNNDALTENMECYFNSDYRETYAITPVTSMYLTPETDRLFRMDDYPERLSGWMERFTQCINRHFKVPVSL